MAGDAPGIGHNSGRTSEPGRAFRAYAWGRARAQLLPTLPIEVVRRRVARARDLGLPYKTYAGLRAASGDDLIGFLFSSNALGVVRAGQAVPADRGARVIALHGVRTLGFAQGRVDPAQIAPPVEVAEAAPPPMAPWSEVRGALHGTLSRHRLAGNRMVLVCETELELEWLAAGRLAGALPAAAFFGTTQ